MAMTESDGATASQKCDPYAVGFEECANFLTGKTSYTHTLMYLPCDTALPFPPSFNV